MHPAKKEKVYIFDACVFITLHQIDLRSIRLPDEIWNKLDELIVEGKIISHRTVYDEVVSGSKKPDKVSAWLQPRKSHFELTTPRQIEIMADVVNQFPKLVDVDSEREQADPWLVALGVEKNEQSNEYEFVVVTQENQTKATKLPAACRAFSMQSISLAEFFEEMGITFGVAFNASKSRPTNAPASNS
jgi:hypothetical protein